MKMLGVQVRVASIVGHKNKTRVSFHMRSGSLRSRQSDPSSRTSHQATWSSSTLSLTALSTSVFLDADNVSVDISVTFWSFPSPVLPLLRALLVNTQRQHTFFEEGIVAHVQFGHPFCDTLRGMLLEVCKEQSITCHDGGTYVNMEGPAFSTVAESNMHRQFGAKVIGMTNIAEARLAREAEISFATVAMATDYDCWHPDHGSVTVEMVVATATKNVGKAKSIIKNVISKIAAYDGPPPAHEALKGAIMTAPDAIPPARAKELECLVKKYVKVPDGPAPPSNKLTVSSPVSPMSSLSHCSHGGDWPLRPRLRLYTIPELRCASAAWA